MGHGKMQRLRLLLITMLGTMLFKLLIMRSSIEYNGEMPTHVDQSVEFPDIVDLPPDVTSKPAEENSTPDPRAIIARLKPQSMEIIPEYVDPSTALLNSVTRGCCRKSPDIPEGCYSYCSFDRLNPQTIFELIVHSPWCRLSVKGVWSMMQCMSSGHDHTECCKAKGVHKSKAGDACLDYCSGKLRPEPMTDQRYRTCLSLWEPISDCFKDHILGNSEVKVDAASKN